MESLAYLTKSASSGTTEEERVVWDQRVCVVKRQAGDRDCTRLDEARGVITDRGSVRADHDEAVVLL